MIVLMGVSGTGKSTVAGMLARRLGWDLAEGDDLHPPANVAKMAAGHPLTDDDRWPWLDRVAAWIQDHVERHRPGIVTCSALRRPYRDRLRAPGVRFVYLRGTYDEIAARMATRHGHFMPALLLDSQFADLQPPDADEDALSIDITASAAEQTERIITGLALRPEDG